VRREAQGWHFEGRGTDRLMLLVLQTQVSQGDARAVEEVSKDDAAEAEDGDRVARFRSAVVKGCTGVADQDEKIAAYLVAAEASGSPVDYPLHHRIVWHPLVFSQPPRLLVPSSLPPPSPP